MLGRNAISRRVESRRLGRPLGSGGPCHDLNPIERKIAMMRSAGATKDAIAMVLEVAPASVDYTLKRPRVANYVLLLTAQMGQGLEDGIQEVNDAIHAAAGEAFEIELKNMRELDDLGDKLEALPREQIKAKASATAIAQDILDRAGKRAPTRIVNTSLHGNIPDEAIDRLANVVREMGPAIEVDVSGREVESDG